MIYTWIFLCIMYWWCIKDYDYKPHYDILPLFQQWHPETTVHSSCLCMWIIWQSISWHMWETKWLNNTYNMHEIQYHMSLRWCVDYLCQCVNASGIQWSHRKVHMSIQKYNKLLTYIDDIETFRQLIWFLAYSYGLEIIRFGSICLQLRKISRPYFLFPELILGYL